MTQHFDCETDFIPPEKGVAGITKYTSKKSGMCVYFADVDSQVINGYFCLGTDQPEAGGIEQLIHHLDSSGGLLPRPMRGDMLRPAWQFHGAENPLADRDQSCFVCCALGEPAFLGTFSCSTYLLQNIEAVLELHGYPYKPSASASGSHDAKKEDLQDTEKVHDDLLKAPDAKGDSDHPVLDGLTLNDVDEETQSSDGEEDGVAPQLEEAEYYCLSEAGEGAMAWEGTLQSMFPGSPAFWNRLLNDGKCHGLSSKMRRCYDKLYRPDNLTVIITGSVKNREHILDVLHDHEIDFFESRPNSPAFEKPWNKPIARSQDSVENTAWFVCRNPAREASATVCMGWRGCPCTDLETAMAIKVLTAHVAVGPMWTKIVTAGNAHRISWCQLEYADTCSLVTVHGIRGEEMAKKVIEIAKQTVDELLVLDVNNNTALKLEEIRAMADRVGWHYTRELESEPFLMIASAIAKSERYGKGAQDQIKQRIRPRLIFDELVKKPREYWIGILQTYFKDNPMFSTKVLPRTVSATQLAGISSEQSTKEEPSGDMNFAATSRRAASRPRRRSSNPVGQETNTAVQDDRRNDLVLPSESSVEEKESGLGLLEEHLQISPFPFGDFEEERKEFESRLEVTKDFLENVTNAELKSWNLTSYNPDSSPQHSLFPLNELPIYTFLEDTETSFVYLTAVFDTTHLDNNMRKLLPCVTAALGAFVCPRPPGLDTDIEIENPNEFNPPMDIADSQVSIGLNGEMMQSVFLTIIVRPEKYAWAVGLLHHMMYEAEFSPNFLKFVATEAARGLAANYKMQTAEKPNYECFDSAEINLHSLIKQVYKKESNARLFVGRRRLDLMMEYLDGLQKDPQTITSETNTAWRHICKSDRVIIQIAADVKDLKQIQGDLVAPWKKYFKGIQKPMSFSLAQPTLEPQVMEPPRGTGIAVSVNQPRLPSLSVAVPINPLCNDFPKLCMAAQLFSMAQKWIWSCWDLDDLCSPVIRMPCSYANLMTLNLESYDVIGCLKTMKMLMKDDWTWTSALLTATKLMVVNDPASLELGAQGTIASALLSHLAGQPINVRRDLLKDSMDVTVEDIKHVVNTYLVKFFDPAESCCSLMATDPAENSRLTHRLEEIGYKMENVELQELCKNL